MIPASKTGSSARRIKLGRRRRASVPWSQRFWNLGAGRLSQKALLGFLVGMTLGGVVGAVLAFHAAGSPPQATILGIDQQTGRARLHVTGQPPLPELPEHPQR